MYNVTDPPANAGSDSVLGVKKTSGGVQPPAPASIQQGADLGFYKGGCPIHLKGAPEVERRRRRGVYIKVVSFMHSR